MEELNPHLKFERVDICQINHGDTVILEDGSFQTVGKNDVRYSPIYGCGLFGVYRTPFTRVLFPRWYQGKIISHQTQL